MKKFNAINSITNEIVATGSTSEIAKKLFVTRQSVNKAYKNNGLCQKCKIVYLINDIKKRKQSRRQQFIDAIKLLKRARVIIDDQNKIICEQLNEYSSIGIIEDIDIFFKKLKE